MIQLSNMKTSLGGYGLVDDPKYRAISCPNRRTRKKTLTMRKLSVFFSESNLTCIMCITGTSFVRICVEK